MHCRARQRQRHGPEPEFYDPMERERASTLVRRRLSTKETNLFDQVNRNIFMHSPRRPGRAEEVLPKRGRQTIEYARAEMHSTLTTMANRA